MLNTAITEYITPSKPLSTWIILMLGKPGTRRYWFATRVSASSVRSTARIRMSLMTPGQASAVHGVPLKTAVTPPRPLLSPTTQPFCRLRLPSDGSNFLS